MSAPHAAYACALASTYPATTNPKAAAIASRVRRLGGCAITATLSMFAIEPVARVPVREAAVIHCSLNRHVRDRRFARAVLGSHAGHEASHRRRTAVSARVVAVAIVAALGGVVISCGG